MDENAGKKDKGTPERGQPGGMISGTNDGKKVTLTLKGNPEDVTEIICSAIRLLAKITGRNLKAVLADITEYCLYKEQQFPDNPGPDSPGHGIKL